MVLQHPEGVISSQGAKLCTLPWDKKLCNSKFLNFCQFDEKMCLFYSFYLLFFVKLTEKPQFCKIPSIWRKIGKLCKAFYPMGKKALQNRLASIWQKNWNCKGNFFPIVYLVNHIEIVFLHRLLNKHNH